MKTDISVSPLKDHYTKTLTPKKVHKNIGSNPYELSGLIQVLFLLTKIVC